MKPGSPGDSSERLESVEVTDGETIVDWGVRRVTWFVRKGAGWLPASKWQPAEVLEHEGRAGVVWERRFALRIAVGTELMRVEVRPAPPARQDPFSYLRREARGAKQKTRKTYYKVKRGGTLTHLPDVLPPSRDHDP